MADRNASKVDLSAAAVPAIVRGSTGMNFISQGKGWLLPGMPPIRAIGLWIKSLPSADCLKYSTFVPYQKISISQIKSAICLNFRSDLLTFPIKKWWAAAALGAAAFDADQIIRLSSENRRLLTSLRGKAAKSKPQGPSISEIVAEVAAQGAANPGVA
jgi:hypothetical protein